MKCYECGNTMRSASNNQVFEHVCERPTSVAPKHVFEWATGDEVKDFIETKQRTSDLGEAASIDLCNLGRWLSQVMDYVSDHMVLNPKICWKCHGRANHDYGGFPVCDECHKAVTQAASDPKEVDRAVKRSIDTIAATFAKVSKPRPPHNQLCNNRKIRHSYLIKVPTGYLMYNGTTVADMHKADKWTKAEVYIERQDFDKLGTPVQITRVIQ